MTLTQLATDLRNENAPRASLYWLKIFADHAADDSLRSDVWVETGLREAAAIPGLDAADPTPRLSLLADYHLFDATRLKDQQTFSGDELADLDWNRKYNLTLAPGATNGQTLARWVDSLWDEVGAVSPEAEALEELLVRRDPLWGHNLPAESLLLEILHEAQQIYGGWLPRPALTRIAHALKMPLADVYGVTEFYTMFYTEPIGKKIIRICEDASCALSGSQAVEEAVCRHLQIEPGQTTADGEYTIEPIRCLGLCDHAPAALVNETRHFNLTPDRISDLLRNEPRHDQQSARVGGLVKVALSNVKMVDPDSLAEYQTQGGLAALGKVLHTMQPGEVIERIKASKLVGRGGAAFPTGLKWQYTAANPPGPRHVICNADESEVGAFKDRVLMDHDPFRVIEGLIIACYAVGAERGFIYIRGEHQLGYQRLPTPFGNWKPPAGWAMIFRAAASPAELRCGAGLAPTCAAKKPR